MANMKEIQDRIRSVQDTMKITNAMYTISSSKLKKAKKALEDTEPYYYALQSAISRTLRHVPDLEHRYFDERQAIQGKNRKIGYMVITGDKGMAGAYNHNVEKIAEDQMAENDCDNYLFVLGEMGRQYFTKRNMAIDTQFHYTVQKPTMHRARIISELMVDKFNQGELDEIYIIFTQMNNSVVMEPRMIQLLPLKKATFQVNTPAILDIHQEEIEMVPSEEAVLDMIVPNYITGMIYSCLVESYSSEQNSRMIAMQNSTESAKEILRELNISYNRARQAGITQEITEVNGGARAQKEK